MKTTTVLIICLIIVFGSEIIMTVVKKANLDKLAGYLMDGNFTAFDKLINNKFIKFILPGFNIEYLCLNRYIAEMNDEKVREYVDQFLTRKMSDVQKKAVYQQGFNYFIFRNDEKYGRKCYEELKKLSNMGEQLKNVDATFEVIIEKKEDVLEKLIKDNDSLSGKERVDNEALIAQIYSYKGDEKNTEEYFKKALEDKKKLDEEK